jgi:hypothetical protein
MAGSAPVVIASDQSAIPVSGTVTANVGTTNGLALDATLTGGTQRSKITDGTSNAAVKAASTAAVAADPALVVAISPNNTVGVSGTVTANIGTTNGLALDATLTGGTARNRITDGTNVATVKAASTAPVAGDTALVVSLSPNSASIPVTISPVVDRTASGSITTNQSVSINSQGTATTMFAVTGSWTGTLVFEGSVDGTNFVAVSAENTSTGTLVASTTANGTFSVSSAGYQLVRIRGNTVATGSAAIAINAAVGLQGVSVDAPLPTGSNVIGGVTISGTPAVTVSSGTVTANLGTIAGVATETTLSSLNGKFGSLGQKAMTGSAPVVIASDQSAIPVSGTVTSNIGTTNGLALDATLTGGTQRSKITDGTNNAAVKAASTAAVSGDTALVVAISPNNTVGVSGTVTANAGTGSFTVAQATAGNLNATVVGTVTANVGTTNGLALDATLTGGTQQSRLTDGTNVATIKAASTAPVAADKALVVVVSPNQAALPVSGTVTANIGTTNGLALNATLTGGTQITQLSNGANAVAVANSAPAGTEYGLIVRPIVSGTQTTRTTEMATFVALATGVAVGNNKSLISIVNTGTKVVRLSRIDMMNLSVAATTGVAGYFQVHRITGHSSGTSLTPQVMDLDDTLDSGITVRTGSTVTGQSAGILHRALLNTSNWTTTLNTTAMTHAFETYFPLWAPKTMDDAKPLILRQNQGITVFFATNSSAGSYDLCLTFTQE